MAIADKFWGWLASYHPTLFHWQYRRFGFPHQWKRRYEAAVAENDHLRRKFYDAWRIAKEYERTGG